MKVADSWLVFGCDAWLRAAAHLVESE